jgi:cation:H+ antiporter
MDISPGMVFLGGLTVILLGAELLLRGASRLAAMLRISPIVIGLTIVSVGTSAPELAVGITAASEGRGALAVGNIAGTNILNILFILGLSALIRPLPIRLLSIRLDVPAMIAAAGALLIMSLDGMLSHTEGSLLVLAAFAYTAAMVHLGRLESTRTQKEFAQEYGAAAVKPGHGKGRVAWYAALLLTGIALTVLGAELLVAGAISLASAYGVSDAFIGLTIVAIGTSAPELATTLVATWRNDRDVAIGNLIGSSIYNVLVILGLTVLASPNGVAVSNDVLWIDLPLAAVVALICLPVFRSDRSVSRREGGCFVLAYLVYLATLVFLRA